MKYTVRAVRWLIVSLAGVSLVSGVASGHVRYVTTTEEAGEGLAFLIATLTTPLTALALGGGATAALLSAVVYLQSQPFPRDVAVFRETMRGYSDLVPWLLRLGFGLPLVGSGFAGYFFNPVVDPVGVAGVVRILQIGMGFALLFGFATRLVAIGGLLLFLLSIPFEPLLLFSLEWVPGFLAIGLLGGGRPSADQTLARVATAEGTVYGRIDPVHRLSGFVNGLVAPLREYLPVIVRVGMGISFASLGIGEKLLTPQMGLNVVEKYNLTAVVPVPAETWVLGAGFSELILGLLLILGVFTRASAMTALFVFTLTLFGIPDDPVLAHVGLFSLASTLLITGAGPWALDNRIGAEKPTDETPTLGDSGAHGDGDRPVPTDD